MSSLVTKPAPDFTAQAVMPDNSFAELTLSSYQGKYVVLFFYPLDFTFVCPSEIIAFDKAVAKFKAKNTEVIGVSVDSHFTHLAWKNTPRNQGGIGPIQYPLVADLDKKISENFGVLLEGGHRPARAVPDRQEGRRPPRLGERSAAGPQRGRGPAAGRRLAVPRDARRRLPGQLARRRRGDEAQRQGRGRVPGQARRRNCNPYARSLLAFPSFVWQCWLVILEMAPYLLFGFALAGLMSIWISPEWTERHLGGKGLGPVVKATLLGIPLPLCSCSVIPVVASMRRHGASRAAATSFLLSTPQTGVDSIAVTYALLGPIFAVFRPDRRLDQRRLGRSARARLRTSELRRGRRAAALHRFLLFGRSRGAGLAAGGQVWIRDPAPRSGLAAPGRRGDCRGDLRRVPAR